MTHELPRPEVQAHKLFPTTLVNLQFGGPETEQMNRDLERLIATDPIYRGKDLVQYGSDDFNMVTHAKDHPCIERLLAAFAQGVDEWLRASGYKGKQRYTSKISLFPSYMKPGQAVPPHYHARTELIGIYYVACKPADEPPLKVCTHSEWYRQDNGPLWLLDPRFNAALTELSDTICAKLYPRPGLMTIFPGYLWHGVGPNRGTEDRYAVAANIGVVPDDEAPLIERSFPH